ncbi:MAG TPA: PAS domain S-box protein [Candidatus Hydrogenedentes bacterium]|nr:PAS domain S-box protein [Candidatus Hydrogenedentota bacterium]
MATAIRYNEAKSGGVIHARLAVAVRVERALLTLRYVAYVFMAAVSVAVDEPGLLYTLLIAGAAALMHNIFVHVVLSFRAYHLFVSPFNFALYLCRYCLLIAITGGAASPFVSILLFLLIGYHLYVPQASKGFQVAFLACAGYSFTVLIGWVTVGMDWTHFPLYANLLYIAFGGWLMNIMSRVIQQLDYEARRQAVALQSSESTLRAILDHAAHPILVFDEHNFITDANDSACAFLGAPREKLLGKRFQSYVFDDGSLQDSFAELNESGALDQEMLLIPHDRTERNVEIHIHSFLNKNSRFFVVLFHDITEQKEFEEASRMAKIKLEEANSELQRVVALRMEFYANVANKLRSPLSAMLGFTDMLLDEHPGELNEEQRKALHSCRRSIMRIFGLIEEAFASDTSSSESADAKKTAGFTDMEETL